MNAMRNGGPRTHVRWAWSLVLFALLLPHARAAEEELLVTVRAKGQAPGVGVVARRVALADAVVNAMRETLSARVHSDNLLPLRPILRKTERYVVDWTPLRVDEEENTTWVEADVRLRDRDLDRDVARLMLPYLKRPPRVQLVLGERVGNGESLSLPDAGRAETAFKEGLEKMGLEVSGMEALAQIPPEQLRKVVEGGAAEGAAFARKTLADVVVVGAASTESAPGGAMGNVLEVTARIHLAVFRCADGDMMYDLSGRAAVFSESEASGADQALEDAALRLAPDTAMAAVLAALGVQEGPGQVILTVEMPRTRDRVDTLVEALRRHPRIGGAETLMFSEDTARIRIAYEGPMALLSDLLDGVDVAGRRLEVRRVVGREIDARFL